MRKTKVLWLLMVFSIMMILILVSSCSSSDGPASEGEEEEIETAFLYLDVDCEKNLLLNRYDVSVNLNGERIGEIKHGEYFTHISEVPLGDCSVEFENTEESSVNVKKELTIESDTTYKCTIHTDGDEIVIKDEEIIEGIEGSRLKMPDIVGTNLERAQEELETIGFVNIESKAKDDSSIFMPSNWVVVEQSVAPETEIDKNQEIILTCRKEEDLFNEAYKDLNLADAKKKAIEKGFITFELTEDASYTNVTKRLEKISDEDAEKWIVTDAGKADETTARFYLSYTGEVTVPDVVGMTVKDAKKALRKQYAFNITTEDTDGLWVLDDETYTVKKQSLDPGKVIKYSDEILLTCEEKSEEKKDPETVYYSTNNSSSVKDGDKGKYAYKKRGGAYDQFYIIDFDKGYVYHFTDGNGNEDCDRVKIESGNLNNVIIITYHDGGDAWSYGLHFKYKNNPEHLVVQDNDGFEDDYSPTNLKDALAIKKTKEVRDY